MAGIFDPQDVERSGFSLARLQYLTEFLENHYIRPGLLPGIDLQISNSEAPIFRYMGGHACKESGAPIAQDSVYRIYSMTKPVTSCVIMMLMEECKLALDDRLDLYLPELTDLQVQAQGGASASSRDARPVTILDLLRHTSGFTYAHQYRTDIDRRYRELGIGHFDTPAQVALCHLADTPLEFAPGTAWNYSISTDILGLVIERVENSTLDEVFERRVFKPLQMHDTAFQTNGSMAGRLVSCYQWSETNPLQLQDSGKDSTYHRRPAFLSGGAGLLSTTADYTRFCQMILSGGTVQGQTLLSPKSIELMGCNALPGQVSLPDISVSSMTETSFDGYGFGLGFAVNLGPDKTMLPGSAGDISWGGMANTYFWIDPMEDLIVTFMTQLLPSRKYPVRKQLRTLVYSAFSA